MARGANCLNLLEKQKVLVVSLLLPALLVHLAHKMWIDIIVQEAHLDLRLS